MTSSFQRAVLSLIVLAGINLHSFPISNAYALPKSDQVFAQKAAAEQAAVVEEKVDLSQEQQFKNRVLELVNIEREKYGVAPLTFLEALAEPADVRAEEAARKFSHTRPNGQSWTSVFETYGLDYRRAGENLAYGFMSAETTVRAWMASPSHRQNILHPGYEYIGVGYHKVGGRRLYVSQLFYLPMEMMILENRVAHSDIL